jgi:hypothetical protein
VGHRNVDNAAFSQRTGDIFSIRKTHFDLRDGVFGCKDRQDLRRCDETGRECKRAVRGTAIAVCQRVRNQVCQHICVVTPR